MTEGRPAAVSLLGRMTLSEVVELVLQVGFGLGGRGGGGGVAWRHALVACPDAGRGFVAPGFPFAREVRAAHAVFHEDVAKGLAAVHHGGHVSAGEFPELDVGQEHAGRHEGDQGIAGQDALDFFGLALAAPQLRCVDAEQSDIAFPLLPWPHMGPNADGVPVDDVEHLGAGGDRDGRVIRVRARGRILVVGRQGAGEHRKDQDEQ